MMAPNGSPGQAIPPPWVLEPYRLWSLLDIMDTIDKESLLRLFRTHSIGTLMQGIRIGIERSGMPGTAEKEVTEHDGLLSATEKREFADRFEKMGLSHSADLLREWATGKGGLPKTEILMPELARRIQHELKSVLWLYVPRERAKYYLEAQDGFGESVATAFSSVSYNVEEAGKCFTLSRYTASVFHLMCILEVGLDSLAHALSLPPSQKNWNEILKGIETAIVAIVPGSAPTWKDDKEFYSTAALEFKFFREAWRNHVAHGRARYGDEEAGRILEHVKAFMQHLAARLQERPHG